MPRTVLRKAQSTPSVVAKALPETAAETRPVLIEKVPFISTFLPPDRHTADKLLHASMARATANISPASLAIAGLDWLLHLMMSPGYRLVLYERLFQQQWHLGIWHLLYCVSNRRVGPAIRPASTDRRFESARWQDWPFNFLHQGFLFYDEWWKDATSGVRGVSRHHLEVVSFVTRQLLDMCSPSNHPLTNPDIIDTTVAEGGLNFWQGYANLADDVFRLVTDAPPAGSEDFKVGGNIAVTPGKIVYRNELFELIQYLPATAEVHAEAVLIVPAWIMKYYILDLSPENSLVKYLVGKGHTVFMISWINPDTAAQNLGMEDYISKGIEEALKGVKAITGAKVHAVGYCIGGTLLAAAAAALARDGDETLCSVTLFAAQTDFEEAGELQLFIDESQVVYLEDIMWQQGYLDKYQMAGAFQMLRSNDLVWSRLVKDYLQGKRQPLNDLMAWNADTTRMPYRMHSEYLRNFFLNNDLAEGRYRVRGEVVALKDIHVPVFTVGTMRDHVAPWKSVYKIHLLTECEVTFVLTSGGHNAGIVSEPGHRGRTYQIGVSPGDRPYLPPDEWQHKTPSLEGSWWKPWQEWLAFNSSAKSFPPSLGAVAKGYKVLGDAPGTYVNMK